jgi:hypothetical protein
MFPFAFPGGLSLPRRTRAVPYAQAEVARDYQEGKSKSTPYDSDVHIGRRTKYRVANLDFAKHGCDSSHSPAQIVAVLSRGGFVVVRDLAVAIADRTF